MTTTRPGHLQQTARHWRSLLWGCAAGLFLVGAGEAIRVFALANFHTVIPGQVYRTSQPTAAELERLVRSHGIRTVVNLRGMGAPLAWYLDECRATHRLGVNQEDVCLSSGRLPSSTEIRRLIEVLDHAERPLLIHCQRGADRTGLVSAVALLLRDGVSYGEARRQLGLRYGHIPLGRPASLDRFFELYEEWLAREGIEHEPAAFRDWAARHYAGGWCRGRLEIVERPARLPTGKTATLRVRLHNTSGGDWSFRPGPLSGIHVSYKVEDDHGRCLFSERAGVFDADVPPGGSIDVTLVVWPLLPGHYRLWVDLVDEKQGWFFQMGSEPLEEELDVE